MELRTILTQPIFFKRNRVFRVYTGGLPYQDFFNDENGYDKQFSGGGDGYFPEEWVASAVRALNEKTFGERDGVSALREGDFFFDDLLKAYPDELLGNRKYDCLVKILDSAIRLPFQVHPTKAYSREYFQSDYGKTESWLVLATRENAKIYFGFKNQMTKEEISRLEETSETDKTVFDNLLCCVTPKIGDVFLIRAGLVHAIGEGCTILEVQEPTDFTIQPERWCGEYHLNPKEEFLGLDKDVALDAIDYSLFGKRAQESARVQPKTLLEQNGYKKESLISYDDTPCFAVNRHTLSGGAFTMDFAPAVYICVAGTGVIECTDGNTNYRKQIKRGDYFFLPYAAENRYRVHSENCVLVECKPSNPLK